MKRLPVLLRAALRDDCGGEVIEYSLLLALVVLVGLLAITAFAPRVAKRWDLIRDQL